MSLNIKTPEFGISVANLALLAIYSIYAKKKIETLENNLEELKKGVSVINDSNIKNTELTKKNITNYKKLTTTLTESKQDTEENYENILAKVKNCEYQLNELIAQLKDVKVDNKNIISNLGDNHRYPQSKYGNRSESRNYKHHDDEEDEVKSRRDRARKPVARRAKPVVSEEDDDDQDVTRALHRGVNNVD